MVSIKHFSLTNFDLVLVMIMESSDLWVAQFDELSLATQK